MFHLLILIALVLGGLYYGETHGLVNPGGIIPDLRNIHLPHVNFNGNNENFDYWKKG